MKLTLVMLLFSLMLGCATTLTEEEAIEACPTSDGLCLEEALQAKVEQKEFEREYNRDVDADNWRTCEYIYKVLGAPTYHVGHTHNRRSAPRPRHETVMSDLMYNRCRAVIRKAYGKEAWAEHY